MKFDLICGDSLDVLKEFPDNHFDSIVTDPPYGLSFMGKAWDKSVPSVEIWQECLRVLKPGGHLLAFAGTRTQHRMAVNIEDAGFEIRDMIAWLYGSGFPKSHDVSKAIDKHFGAERKVVGKMSDIHPRYKTPRGGKEGYGNIISSQEDPPITAPATDAARQWEGWGTALKPALEPITVARKPLAKGNTVAANVLEWGTGGVNVDGCRVGDESHKIRAHTGGMGGVTEGASHGGTRGGYNHGPRPAKIVAGRWPANLIHDGSDEVVGLFPETKETKSRKGAVGGQNGLYENGHKPEHVGYWPGGKGSAARFFYCAKAQKKDRNEGLAEKLPKPKNARKRWQRDQYTDRAFRCRSKHPTVKPTDLMRYLCRLVTPPQGLILDPFMGSGSTGKAAVLEGFDFVGIELDRHFVEISRARIEHALKK